MLILACADSVICYDTGECVIREGRGPHQCMRSLITKQTGNENVLPIRYFISLLTKRSWQKYIKAPKCLGHSYPGGGGGGEWGAMIIV